MKDENDLKKIRDEMIIFGLDENFANDAFNFSLKYDGMAELMSMWMKEHEWGSESERDLIISDLKDLITDIKKISSKNLTIRKFSNMVKELSPEVRKEAFYLTLEMLKELGEIGPEDIVRVSKSLGFFVDEETYIESDLIRSLRATAKDLGLSHVLDSLGGEKYMNLDSPPDIV